MASKSKKRRRVLGASCILAALIIAGSSFAWFTSKDEVTNRLTASSDYGVSIVESFTPPKMWVPGQKVNKDVYAVNTGNIDAYVKENISGRLSYTFENKVGVFDKKCLTLDDVAKTAIDGVTNNEAGGYLAWTDASEKGLSFDGGKTKVKLGSDDADIQEVNTEVNSTTYKYKYVKDGKVYVSNTAPANGVEFFSVYFDEGEAKYKVRDTDHADNLKLTENDFTLELGELASARENEDPTVASRWTPSKTGTYIFRRSIIPADGSTNTPQKYTYAGYHFVKGEETDSTPADDFDDTKDRYYKIVIGDDNFRATEGTGTGTDKSYVFDIYAPQSALGEGIKVDENGKIVEGTPKIYYVKEKEINDQDVMLTYENKNNDHPARLVANFATALTPDGDVYDATAVAAQKQLDYINKKGQYDQDRAKYEQARADFEYALALSTAREALRKAAQDMYDKNDAVNGTGNTNDPTTGTDAKLKAKWDALKNEANGGGATPATTNNLKYDLTQLAITGDNVTAGPILCPDALLSAITDTGTNAGSTPKTALQIINEDAQHDPIRLTDVQKNYTRMKDLWTEIQNDIKDINDTLGKYTGDDNHMITPEQAEEYETIVDTKFKHLAKTLREYAKAYADLTANTDLATYLGYTDGLDNSTSTSKAAILAKANDINANDNSAVTIDDDFNEAVQEYINAYNYNEAATDALTTESENWTKAKAKYNEDVAAAKKAYEEVINQTANLPQPGYADPGADFNYKDNSSTIVPAYSARRESQAAGVAAPFAEAPNNTTRNAEKSYNPQLNANNGYLDGNEYPADYDYYRTLEDGKTGVGLPTDGTHTDNNNKLDVAAIPDNAVEVNKNTAWNESAFYNTKFVAADTIKSLYEATYGADGISGSKKAYEDAKLAYETAKATLESSSNIKIYVNLNDEFETRADGMGTDGYWQYAGDTDPTGTTPTKVAEFYYRYLLAPGETSHKLVDSVTLADTVTANDYKNLTFDLNVGLDSAQVTYADDQRTITTEAVDANKAAFKLRVEDNNPESLDDQFKWVDRDVTRDAIYKATIAGDTKTINAPTKTDTPIGTGSEAHTYKWKFTIGEGAAEKTYVGDTETGTYYKLNGAAIATSGTDIEATVAKS